MTKLATLGQSMNLISAVVGVLLILAPTGVVATPTVPKIEVTAPLVVKGDILTQDEIKTLINKYAADLSTTTRQTMLDACLCESGGNWHAIGALGEVGLVQILPRAHPQVPREQMLDPDFSINFMAGAVRAGHESWWTCWNKV